MATRRLTRDQIAKIVDNDPEAIRAFEDLFRQATAEVPAEVTTLRQDVDALNVAPAGVDAVIALDWLNRIQDRIDRLAYAELVKNFDQVAGAINTATAVTWDSFVLGRGVSLGSPASRVVFERKGVYEMDVSVQLSSNNANQKNVWLWYRVNGTDVPSSAVIETETANNGFASISRTEFFELSAGDYVELMFAVDDTGLFINADAATAFAPAAPAAIATIKQVCA
jgi:hypothetical protein